jgi:hypothetical protein
MKYSTRLLVRSLICAAVLIPLLALQSLQSSAVFAQSVSFLRIIHASPDIGIVDVFVDKKEFINSFEYAKVTDYIPIPPGSHMLQIALLGKGVNAAAITKNITIAPNTAYTIAALGTQASGFSATVFVDNNTVAVNGTKVRFYHLAPGMGTVRLDAGNFSLAGSVSYPQASEYAALPSGNYTFDLQTLTGDAKIPVTLTLKPLDILSVFAVGFLDHSPRLQFITKEIAGIPNLPKTGSDPRAASSHTQVPTQASAPWQVGPVVVIGAGALIAGIALAYLAWQGYMLVSARRRNRRELS